MGQLRRSLTPVGAVLACGKRRFAVRAMASLLPPRTATTDGAVETSARGEQGQQSFAEMLVSPVV